MSERERIYGTADWGKAAWREQREDINLLMRQFSRRINTAVEAEIKARFDKSMLTGESLSLSQPEIMALVVRRCREVAEMFSQET